MPLNIARTVLERLDPSLLAIAVSEFEHADVTCIVCGRDIPVGSTEQSELVLFEDPARRGLVMNYAHSRCAKSDILVRPFPPMPDALDTSFTLIMRDHVLAPAVVWELVGAVRAGTDADSLLIDPIARGLRERGFRIATQRLGDLVAPVAQGWALVQHGDDLRLCTPDGGRADEFRGAMRAPPPGWLEAVRLSKTVLVVYGSGFGLEYLDLARIDRVMQSGEAVAGLVKWSGAPPSSRRRRK